MNYVTKVVQNGLIAISGCMGGVLSLVHAQPVVFLMIAAVCGLIFYGVGSWLHSYNVLVSGKNVDLCDRVADVGLRIFGFVVLVVVAVMLYFVGGYDGIFAIFRK